MVPPPAKPSGAYKTLAALVLLAGAGAAAYAFVYANVESTDDAQVEGHVMNVAARVGGQVTRVNVRDNEVVEEGHVLVELDKSELQMKVAAASAEVSAAKALAATTRAQLSVVTSTSSAAMMDAHSHVTIANAGVLESAAAIDLASAEGAAAEARLNLAQLELTRTTDLYRQGAIPIGDLQRRQSEHAVARAASETARARLEHSLANKKGSAGRIVGAQGKLLAAQTAPALVESAKASVDLADARVESATAALRLAELNLTYATVRAPHRGSVSRRTVEVGQAVTADRALMAIIPDDDVWIVANFKEDQIAKMHPGQRATIKIDTYGREKLSGKIDSFAGATGARFALLPPDNATGNFVKVVQRIPVLIRLDTPPAKPLRLGMSAYVVVDTVH